MCDSFTAKKIGRSTSREKYVLYARGHECIQPYSQSAAMELHHNRCSSNNSRKPHDAAIVERARLQRNKQAHATNHQNWTATVWYRFIYYGDF